MLGIPWQASTAVGTGSIPGWGTKIPRAAQHSKKKKKKKKKKECIFLKNILTQKLEENVMYIKYK